MKVKERIEELKDFATCTDYEWLTSNFITGNALNKLYDELSLFRGDKYSNPHTHQNYKAYKYAKQILLDYIKKNVDTILELTLEEKDKLYKDILDKAVEEYK